MDWWDYGSYDSGSDYSYTPSSDYSFSADYSLGSSGSSGVGLQMPSDFSYGSGYNLYGGGSSGVGLQMPTDFSYGSGYNLYGGGSSGLGLQAPSVSAGPTTGSFTFGTSAPSIYALPGGGSSLGFQSPAQVGSVGGITPMAGPSTGLRVAPGAGAATAESQTLAPATGQAGLTGSFGGAGTGAQFGSPEWQQNVNMLSDTRMAREGRTAFSNEGAEPTLIENVRGGLREVTDWARANPKEASMAIQGIGALVGAGRQREANRLARQQLALQQQAIQSQQQAIDRNNQQAQFWNQQAVQSANEARSLYNPQELAIRGMSQQVAATGRREQEAYQAALKRGMSPADAAAEARRVRVAGSTAATTGYMQGLDTGRGAMQGALTSAKGLGSQYAGLNYNPSFAGAEYMAKQGEMDSARLRALLEAYTGYPTDIMTEQERRRRQEESVK